MVDSRKEQTRQGKDNENKDSEAEHVDEHNSSTYSETLEITSVYGSRRGEPQFSPNSDIDDYGVITREDVDKRISHYRQKDP